MKKKLFIYTIIGLILTLPLSCSKEDEDDNEDKKEVNITLPVISTIGVSNIKQSTAICECSISDNGGTNEITSGVCWSTEDSTTVYTHFTDESVDSGAFTSTMTGLYPNTTYYVRAYATNSAGTAFGDAISFTTLQDTLTVTDIDGNVYNTVTIGSQVWFSENLKVTNLNEGTSIPEVIDKTEWTELTTPGLCWYGNLETVYDTTFGPLYNWYAINTGKLCPEGWHVPSETEWSTLADFLGGELVAGGKLKEDGTLHWVHPNTAATNETNFTALPGGYRYTGTYLYIDYSGYWWTTSTSPSDIYGIYVTMSCLNSKIYSTNMYKENGLSVRCIKDSE